MGTSVSPWLGAVHVEAEEAGGGGDDHSVRGDPARGVAVQVDPVTPALKASGSTRLTLGNEKALSNFAFNFNLRRYMVGSNSRNVDVYGQHLAPDMALLSSFCASLAPGSPRAAAEEGAAPGEVRLKCLVALATGGKPDSAHAFRIGFNAVMIAGGPGVGPSLVGWCRLTLSNPS
jgi:hypothetical protein